MLPRLAARCARFFSAAQPALRQRAGTRVGPNPTAEDLCAAVALLAQFRNVPISATALLNHVRAAGKPEGHALDSVLEAASATELQCEAMLVGIEALPKQKLPAIALMQDNSVLLIAAVKPGTAGGFSALVQHPATNTQSVIDSQTLAGNWSGTMLSVDARQSASTDTNDQFGLSWFWSALMDNRSTFTDVLLAACLLHVFALLTPLFFQVVMDKVLIHEGYTTLTVLGIGLASVLVFDAVLGALRNHLTAHTAHRIDIELGSRVFKHLTSLPMGWFNARTTGQSVAKIRELEVIRQFLTGSAVTLSIDLVFTALFFGVLWLYSPKLTLLVAAVIPVYIALSLVTSPFTRKLLSNKHKLGTANQSFLVESIAGMETLKSQAADAQFERRWDSQLRNYADAAFRSQSVSGATSEFAKLVNKLTTLGVIWVGALEVMAGAMTVGQLVAFNMIAARVCMPILRCVQLFQDFQQAGQSLQQVSELLNTKRETDSTSVPHARRLSGAIAFERVSFRYQPDAEPVLDELSFAVAPGEVIGIVGRSGSGKSTVARLLQRLHLAERGRIALDGQGIEKIQPRWLRRQVGRVEQESVLFNGSVRENIALANPAAPQVAIEQAARLAGAHQFIVTLQNGYDTMLDERGSNLSGGQRQRIALARSLLSNPAILILDEATSALDVETEQVVQRNMPAICKNRTVIIIAHRLSAVRNADRILVLDEGRVVEQGSHDMLAASGGHYASMLQQQSHHIPRRKTRVSHVEIEV